ncbi:MAG: S-layer homology domain-containing protein, partial [Oscillospiraceae bacterium]
MKRILSLLLFVMMSLSALTPFTYAAEPRKVENEIISTIPEKIEYATREQAVLQFVNAIGRDKLTKPGTNLSAFSDYQDIDPKCIDELSLAVGNGLISGYDDRTLRPKDNIYRVEALVLLSRALKSIELVPLCDTTFTDTPEWANYDIQRLASSKIVLGYGDGTFGANDYITTEQIRVLINRITEQPTPKTDYYAYVNSEWRTFSQIPDGYPEWSDTYQLSQDIAYRMQDIVTGLLNAKFYNGMEYEPGSNEQKIIDTYLTAADMKYRDEVGLKAIQPYLELIDSAASVTDLISVMASLEKAGFHGLLPIKIETNFKNSSKYSLAFESCYTGVDTAMIQSGEYESVINKYEEYITKLLIVSGQDEKLAKGNARSVCNLCVELGKASLSSGDWNNMELLHNPYTRRDFGRLFNNIDTYKYLDELGYSSAKSVVVMDTELAKFINKYLTKENIELLKSYLRVSLLDQSSFYLNTDMYKIREEYVNFVNGTNSKVPPEGYAISIAQSMLGLEMGELYIDNFFSADAKIYVEDMAKKIIETYEKRIENLDWMGWHTKKTAIEKLKAIRIQIGYPEYIIGYTNKGFNVKGGKEGGSLMENMINFNVLKNTQNSQIITEELPVNKDEWVMLPQTVNAYYN